jgi:predicted DNA-binding transcriptional regulator YafY
MNRTDRLLGLILQLQAKPCQRAEDLAAHFEISKRTIYRDIEALCEAGVPVISTPGQGFSLVENYFLPSLNFTADEATLLLLGVEVMAQSFDAELHQAAQSATTKIRHVLPELLQTQVQRTQDNILFIPHAALSPAEIDCLRQLRRAILRQQTIQFDYYARSSEPTITRQADPHKLVYVAGNWHLTAYCHLRQDFRTFRLARIDNLTLLPKTFTPLDISISEREREGLGVRNQVVRLLFSPEVTRWVQEDPYYFITDKIPTPEGLIVILHVRRLEDMLQWVLGWGRHVLVLEPENLRDLLLAETQAMLNQLQAATPVI